MSGDIEKVKEVESLTNIRPEMSAKFRPGVVNQLIEAAIKEILADKEYNAEEAEEWTRSITDAIHEKTKEQDFARYKFVSLMNLLNLNIRCVTSYYKSCMTRSSASCWERGEDKAFQLRTDVCGTQRQIVQHLTLSST